LLSVLVLAHATGVTNPRTLVLYDDASIRTTHSIFLSSLQERGHKLTFAHVNDEETKLAKYGEYLFENLVVFSPNAEDLPAGVSVESIVAFIDSGRNALIAVNRNVSEPLRSVANECGIDFDEEETAVVDHVNFDVSDSDGDHTLVLSDKFVKSPIITGKGPSAPVLFRGIGHLGSSGTKLLIRVLTASETAFSAVPGTKVVDFPQSAGVDTLLITALQARNNARVVFSGSLDLFSDKFFSSPVQLSPPMEPQNGTPSPATRSWPVNCPSGTFKSAAFSVLQILLTNKSAQRSSTRSLTASTTKLISPLLSRNGPNQRAHGFPSPRTMLNLNSL